MTILLAFDSFKGCLSSTEVCHAAAAAVLEADPDAIVKLFPLSDGGEGLTEVLTRTNNGRLISVRVHGPLMESIIAQYGIIPSRNDEGDTAIIEMAAACGLPLVPIDQRNPELTTTYGFGEMILDALKRGCKRLILGIGGSATNDAGMGMLQALGATIRTTSDTDIFTGSLLSSITHIDTSRLQQLFHDVTIHVACDVQNPLCGPQGAAYVFAPQKGADANAVSRLDAGLSHILDITHEPTLPGDGAAGGLGFALRHFLHATMMPGIELVLSQLHFDEQIPDANLIITGEGKCDAQTLMGKVPMGVLCHAKRYNKPVLLMAGMIDDVLLLRQSGFMDVRSINEGDPAPLSELMLAKHALCNIRRTIKDYISSSSNLRCKSR